MVLHSRQLSIELADSNGKIIPYYTYDGYLDEHDRHSLRHTERSLEQLKFTGAAAFGLLGFAVNQTLLSSPANSHSPYSASRESHSPLLDYSQE